MNSYENISLPQVDVPELGSDPMSAAAASEAVSAEAFAILDDEAKNVTDVYTHKFKKPFTYQGKTYAELTFDFDSLHGQDSLDIMRELQVRGETVIVKTMSDPYLMCMAAKACSGQIGSDAFALMKLKDHNKILGAARAFLHSME